MQRLDGKTCVLTGAERGIGRSIAARFRDEGSRVVLTDLDEAAGLAAASEIRARFIRLDVAREADWLELPRLVPAADVVVNNAGITGFEAGPVRHDPEHASLEDWRAVHREPRRDLPRLPLCDQGNEGAQERIDHQHLLAVRPRRHPPCCGLCLLERFDPQPPGRAATLQPITVEEAFTAVRLASMPGKGIQTAARSEARSPCAMSPSRAWR